MTPFENGSATQERLRGWEMGACGRKGKEQLVAQSVAGELQWCLHERGSRQCACATWPLGRQSVCGANNTSPAQRIEWKISSARGDHVNHVITDVDTVVR